MIQKSVKKFQLTNYSMDYRHWFYQNTTPPLGTEFTWDFPVAYSKCKYIILAFQTNKDNQANIDNSKFDFCNLENVQVLLNNNIYYPRERLNLKRETFKVGKLYNMYKEFKRSYYGMIDDPTGQPLIDFNTFLTNAHINPMS